MSFGASPDVVTLPPTASHSDNHANVQENELEDRLVADPFVLREQSMDEQKDLGKPTDRAMTTSLPSGGSENPDIRLGKAATENAPEFEDSRPSERGSHSESHSVIDELSGPFSDIEDDAHFAQAAEGIVSSDGLPHPHSTVQNGGRDHNSTLGSELEGDDFEGADGEIDSESNWESQDPKSEEQRGRIVSPNGRIRETGDAEWEEDGEVIQVSPDLLDEQEITDVDLDASSGQSGLEELGTNEINAERKEVCSSDARDFSLETFTTELEEDDEEFAQQPRRDSDISLFYPQQLEPEDVVNPFSLEVRILKAREHQDITLKWEAETIVENLVGISRPLLDSEETSRSIRPDVDEIFPDQPPGSSERAVENGFHVKERIKPDVVHEVLDEDAKEASKNKTGVGEAVLLGALASGVNRPTWFVVRAVLVALVASLLLLLHVAIKSGSWFVLLNVLFLISIAGGLILLLGWYISEVGLVPVDKQMTELNLTSEPKKVESKTL